MRNCKWIIILAVWTFICTGDGFSQIMATLTLPDTSASLGDTVAISITVSTDSIIGLAQFVVEFDSNIIQFQDAVVGKDVPDFTLIQSPNLPFATTASGTNENALIQISGGGAESFNGQGKEVAKLKFIVVSSSGKSSLVFDQMANHTFLTTTQLKDISNTNIDFVDGCLHSLPPYVIRNAERIRPERFILHQNYPNPFNPETKIKYELPQAGKVVLKVYNIVGQEISTLVDEVKPAGLFEVVWDGRDNTGQRAASGLYLYRIERQSPSTGSGQGFVQTRKMLLLQ